MNIVWQKSYKNQKNTLIKNNKLILIDNLIRFANRKIIK